MRIPMPVSTLANIIGPFFCLLILSGLLFSQEQQTVTNPDKPIKYFRVDKMVTVTGTVQAIKSEKNYNSRKSDFVVAYLKEKQTGKEYKIELSPAWYFDLDIVEGSKIKVTGSQFQVQNQPLIMVQSLVYQGTMFNFRDKLGFPLWRGKGNKMRDKDNRFNRKQKQERSKGRQ